MFKSLLLMLIFLIVAGCSSYNNVDKSPSVKGDIEDNASWYNDANNDLLVMEVIIPSPNSSLCLAYDDLNGTSRPCTLEDIDNDIEPSDNYAPILDVQMTTNSFTTPELTTNAQFKIRGNYSRKQRLKSYSLRLNSSENLFMSQRKFQLVKSQSDRSRSKNKLAYDLFRNIPNITSLKTQFVHLYINGEDYGLFTHVEAMRKEYLTNRGWNENDRLYNAENFQFKEYYQLAVNSKGDPKDEELFETVLEIKNGEDHSKVNEMLAAVNSKENIDSVIKKYFNRDNYLKWLAINLLLSNKDTSYHNFFLYNPLHSDTFYFLPWDYDGAWARSVNLGKFEYGISVWWESPLHRKFLSIEKNRNDLYAMVEELREKYITDEAIRGYLASYKESIADFAERLPDTLHNSANSWAEATENLAAGIDDNIELYKSVIGHPMPFREYVELSDNKVKIYWDESVDLEGDEIVYDIKIALDENFDVVVFEKNNFDSTSYILKDNEKLNPGIYYLEVISKEKNNPNHYQIAFDYASRYGLLQFEVK